MQKHAARGLHWDLRLEIAGALHSWAVPKGPSPDPADKRLAVETEDHPLEYAEFEGIIPEGNYGAGAMIVWDRGTWVPLNDIEAGLAKGKLLFELRGHKLRGRFTLFRTKQGPKSWIFMKERDGWAGPVAQRAYPEDSVVSSLTVEELRDGNPRRVQIRERLERLGAPRRAVRAADVEPMLAGVAPAPFSRAGWYFELKYDGFRLLAARERGEVRLLFRRGSDATAVFPEISRALAGLPWTDIVLDGEIVVLDGDARPSFGALQKRVHLTRAPDVRRAAAERPATLYLFDLLGFEEFDLRPLPLAERKELLRRLLPSSSTTTGALRFADHVDERGVELFEAVRGMGLEGVVAKRADAPYRAGRGRDWLKVRHDRAGDFAVVGYEPRRGAPGTVGSLHLALRQGDAWLYAGSVGSGLTEEAGAVVAGDARLQRPPCAGAPAAKTAVWLEPRRVAEVRYKEWTADGLLRQPVFLRWRDDKTPEECLARDAAERDLLGSPAVAPDVAPVEDSPAPPALPAAAPASDPPARRVALTRLDKVFWPDEGYTKGDLVEYYREVSPWLLPYLADRPVVLTRYPDGIAGKSFFQKDAPSYAPEWVRTERIWSEDGGREIDYFVVDSTEALLYLANLATIPLHVWQSRIATLARPDWCILDLDPKEAPFAHVVTIARELRRLTESIELPSFVKTSGSSGLHVLIPLGRSCTFEQARTLAAVLARVVAEALPEIATVERRLESRRGRVYIDALQNGHGKLLVAPLAARAVPGATVSMPLRWRDVGPKLDLRDYTIRTAPRRLARMKEDPLRAVLTVVPDLPGALERLAARLG